MKYRPSSDKCERDSWIFLDNFSTSYWWNSVIKIVRWFKLINSSNHLTISLVEFRRKVVQENCEVTSTFHITLNCLTCANFELSSSNFVRKCSNTKSRFIRNSVSIDRGVWILEEFKFKKLSVDILKNLTNLKNSLYVRSFLCEETKTKQHTSVKKELESVKSVKKQIGNPDSHVS